MAARKIKIRHDDETRAKIQASQIINRLTNHIFGKVEMTPSQVTAGLGLLKKSIPDLQAVEHSGGVTLSHEDALSELDGSGEANPAPAKG